MHVLQSYETEKVDMARITDSAQVQRNVISYIVFKIKLVIFLQVPK